ncbi:non-hydrolyzing UDP-N-acetylglucosamine 2-epimerase [Taylorella equigenitalis]|uniref:non-hydrolyzing UDP-N-acetylglucosamine 2-epimerase n=1 Tax=Taylorella equigenitalis TaxID=29575 RepID=UPI0004023B70|nr:UDP-N-acetylglucosamine 2-epimerase (non-hydrolyzing) [Taylorella equigenitalis]ASY37464.1 UDP-N-acetylglucosamine 2-epimerase (non-hydrolyzing) [Taylorella equigenitalis]KGK33032.1 UDP-N-acetylglucosamine 2-epimerase [Taylorella equigenitalis]WDU46757.1 UDP-N-acetylglucosamine 2-epimerase (non-hydrolyzing) [Taylorella equigenitalis]
MNILTVIGARPQFIKASVVSKALKEVGLNEILLHTGQHYDHNMSEVFFNQLGIPKPHYKLDINGCSHGEMTGRMLSEIEKILLSEKPDRVLVYGDTNSTLAGALAATKLHIPVDHIEAGLRSFNKKMPEEINRILTDQISDILFCPTDTAVDNLKSEGFLNRDSKIYNVGDVMCDSVKYFSELSSVPVISNIQPNYILCTIHRAENTDDPQRLTSIINALNYINRDIAPVLLALHPRTKKIIGELGLEVSLNVIDPVGYLEMLSLIKSSNLVITDSGGLQKEAYILGKFCVTLRDQTEWVELLKNNVNKLAGADYNLIIDLVKENFGNEVDTSLALYGSGNASKEIAKILHSL